MDFVLENPWCEWMVLTPIGKKIFSTKVDSGAMVTFVGITIALAMGIDKALIKKQKCVKIQGVTGARGYAFKVPCNFIKIEHKTVAIKYIYVPFEFIEGKRTYRFVNKTKYLIGTDVLRNYNLSVMFSGERGSGNVNNSVLNLQAHGLSLPPLRDTEYSLSQLVPQIDEITTMEANGDNTFTDPTEE